MYNILYNNFLEREKIMYTDYHIHSTFSPDGKSSMEEMILRAIDLNLKEICFTDHVDYDICICMIDGNWFLSANLFCKNLLTQVVQDIILDSSALRAFPSCSLISWVTA